MMGCPKLLTTPIQHPSLKYSSIPATVPKPLNRGLAARRMGYLLGDPLSLIADESRKNFDVPFSAAGARKRDETSSTICNKVIRRRTDQLHPEERASNAEPRSYCVASRLTKISCAVIKTTSPSRMGLAIPKKRATSAEPLCRSMAA